MECNDFCNRYEIDISQEKFIDIRYTIRTALLKLKMQPAQLNCAHFPQKPLLIDIDTSTSKGCSKYYKILNMKANLNNKIYLRENLWHLELNQHLSVQFWDNAKRLCASINFDNQLRWLQFQIVRNSLQTNYIVSHFKPNVSPTCSYCRNLDNLERNLNNLEKISHLFWTCVSVSEFLGVVFMV